MNAQMRRVASTYDEIRGFYRATIRASVSKDWGYRRHGDRFLMGWRDPSLGNATMVGVFGGRPYSVRMVVSNTPVHDRVGKECDDIIRQRRHVSNLLPDDVAGTPPEMVDAFFRAVAPVRKALLPAVAAELDPAAEALLDAFVSAIDLPALLGAISGRMSAQGYDHLRQTTGPMRELLEDWPVYFDESRLADLTAAELGLRSGIQLAALIHTSAATGRNIQEARPSRQVVPVLHLVRGMVPRHWEIMHDGIEFASRLDPDWLPPPAACGDFAFAEWEALMIYGHTALMLQRDVPGFDAGDGVPTSRPARWRDLVAAMA